MHRYSHHFCLDSVESAIGMEWLGGGREKKSFAEATHQRTNKREQADAAGNVSEVIKVAGFEYGHYHDIRKRRDGQDRELAMLLRSRPLTSRSRTGPLAPATTQRSSPP